MNKTVLALALLCIGLVAAACSDGYISNPVERAPQVTITAPVDNAVALEGLPVTLTGTVADDLTDAEEMTIAWSSSVEGPFLAALEMEDGEVWIELGDGLALGEHTISLTATDEHGMTGSDEVTITCEPNRPPEVAWASPEDGDTMPDAGAQTLVAPVSDEHDTPQDLLLRWESSVAGELVGTADFFGTTVTYELDERLSPGAHTLVLEAWDQAGAFARDQIDVTVSGAANLPPEIEFVLPTADVHYQYWDIIPVEVLVTDDRDSAEQIALDWGGLVDLQWVDDPLPEHPTTAGVLNATILLDCVYYDEEQGPWTSQIILTATDSEGASAVESQTVSSFCLWTDA